MEKKLTKRQQQAAATKERIMQCALDLFAERDYESVTIADIRQAAGVSVGSFYHYFSSKDALLLSVYSLFDKFVEEEFSSYQFTNQTETIIALLRRSSISISYGYSVFSRCLQARLRIRDNEFTSDDRYFPRYLQQLVEKAMDTGEIHPSHKAEEVTRMLLQTSRGIMYDWALRSDSFSVEDQIEKTVRLLFVALRQPAPEDAGV